MSGGGNPISKIAGGVSSGLTMGALSTNGKGWAQGGGITGALDNATFGLYGDMKKRNEVGVPDAMNPAQWNLTTPDGKMRSDLQLGAELPQAAKQSQGILDQLQARATATGPSQSAQYLQGANERNTNNSLAQAAQMSRSGLADATSGMAMRGGLDAGARERMAKSNNFSAMMGKQKILNDSAGNNLNILSQDENQKTQMMQALPSSLLAQAGFDRAGKQFDISNTLSTVGNKYQTDMQAWGANQAAREQAQLANKPQGLLGLGMFGL